MNTLEKKYELIKEKYLKLHRDFLKTKPLLIQYHDNGVWAPSIKKELFKIFQKYNDKEKNFLDLGSGDGLAVMIASLFFKHAHGIEIDKGFFDISQKMKQELGIKNITLIHDNFYNIDFHNFDILFIAPDKEFTLKLENKLEEELTGKLIVYSSIFQPKTLKKTDEFETHHFIVCVYENTAKKV